MLAEFDHRRGFSELGGGEGGKEAEEGGERMFLQEGQPWEGVESNSWVKCPGFGLPWCAELTNIPCLLVSSRGSKPALDTVQAEWPACSSTGKDCAVMFFQGLICYFSICSLKDTGYFIM